MIYSIILFLIGFVFLTLHESNLHRKTFTKLGKWFSPENPKEMKEKFPLLSFVWNFYHFSEWFAIVLFYTAFFISYLPYIPKWLSSYLLVGIFVSVISLFLNFIFYGIYGKEKK